MLASVLSAAMVPTAAAGPFEGEWIGGFQIGQEMVWLQVRFGGSDANMTGRADVPAHGLRDALLRHVQGDDRRLAFEIVGTDDTFSFTGALTGQGTLSGSVRAGSRRTRFELRPSRRLSAVELGRIQGGYVVDDHVLLLYGDGNALGYIDYDTGQLGRLFPLRDGRFAAGLELPGQDPSLIVVAERDGEDRVVGVSWQLRGKPVRHYRRSQAYRSEAAQFRSRDGVMLSGVFLIPNTPGPHPSVVVASGSGATHATSLMPYADSLARGGVAVLLFDKRGVGASGGTYLEAGIDVQAADALAGVDWLHAHPAVDADRIGIVGMSLGGWVAPLAASRDDRVTFLLLEAAPAVTPAAHERLRVERQMKAADWPSRDIDQALAFMDRKFEVARTGIGWDELNERRARGLREGWLTYVNAPVSLEALRWSWDHLLSYDPRPALESLRVPVLALYGGADTVVDSNLNATVLEGLLAAHARNVTVRKIPDANHSFLRNDSAPGRARAFVRGYFEQRVAWVLSQGRPSAERRPVLEPSTETPDPIEAAGTVLPRPPQCGSVPGGDTGVLACAAPPPATYMLQP
ncbi:MAG: alpha/beta hydrolase family protein [Vicinamibacterales bacterium]